MVCFIRNIIAFVGIYLALCLLILILFGWLFYFNLYALISIWVINTIVYIHYLAKYCRSELSQDKTGSDYSRRN